MDLKIIILASSLLIVQGGLILSQPVPVFAESIAPAPISLRAVVSSPIIDRQIFSPISFTPPVVSGKVILAPSGFQQVEQISNPIADNKIATLAAPLINAAAGYAI